MTKEKKKEVQKNRCSSCGSTLVYFRIKDHSRVCRGCGKIEDILDEETNKKEEE